MNSWPLSGEALKINKEKKINVQQKNAADKMFTTLYKYKPIVYGIWHLFYQLLFVLQLLGHGLNTLLVILISILKKMVTNWERKIT